MSQLHRLYQNPSIPKGRYAVRIIDLKTEPASRRPFIEIVVEVSSVHGSYGGVKLYVPIHPTPDADSVYEGFLKAFDLEASELDKARGRYARVVVKTCTHKNTEYSGVRFVPQRGGDYSKSAVARKADKAKQAAAEKKAAEKAKKAVLKAEWEAVHGPRGRGRPKNDAVPMETRDLFAE